jgi:short-subunit dehydrogenase
VSAHGMKHIALVSRSGASAAVAHSLEPALLNAGAANVDLFAVDLADREAVKDLLADLDQRRPVGAIVHAAGVLHDELLRDVSGDTLARVVAPKLDAALAIDTASRALSQLTHFIAWKPWPSELCGSQRRP